MAGILGAGAWVAATLLVLAGAAKLRRPAGTAVALGTAGLPSAAWLVRALGAVELTVGMSVLVVGGPVPAGVTAALYVGFTAFAWWRGRDGGASCGCFGGDATPLTGMHLAVDGLAAVITAGAAATGAPALAVALRAQPWPSAATTAVLVAVTAGLVRLLLTAVPELRAAVALHPRPEGVR